MEPSKLCNYEGNLDENYARQGTGKDLYKKLDGDEVYRGTYKNDCYHGIGQYKSDTLYYPWTYEGSFFSNKKEGYGMMSYPDGSFFQGLYKTDRQFGPGILTHINGTDDVGFWVGSKIVRLITKVGSLPQLGTSREAQVKILRYKKLIRVTQGISPMGGLSQHAIQVFVNSMLANLLMIYKYPFCLYSPSRIVTNGWLLSTCYSSLCKFYPDEHIAKKIMKEIGANDDTIKHSNKLYSIHSKEPVSLLFNKKHFMKAFLNDLTRIEVPIIAILSNVDLSPYAHNSIEEMYRALQEENESLCPIGSGDVPADILAWNNYELPIQLLIHCFHYHQFENCIEANVSDILLRKRSNFKPPGQKEIACLEFLKKCSTNDVVGVASLMIDYKLHPDLSDSTGNTGLMRAAAEDNHEMLKLFLKFDADINILNDEGFSPLTHCLTRYISIKNDIHDWGKAFLPPSSPFSAEQGNFTWMAQLSILAMKLGDKKKQTDNGKENKTGRKYIFDLRPAQPPKVKHQDKKKKLNKEGLGQNGDNKELKGEPQSASPITKKERENLQRLSTIERTIILLLENGANPNASEVPASALLLAIFAGNEHLVKLLLELGANPNAKLLPEEGSLTILHVMCLLPPQSSFPKIALLLLNYGADPNTEADVSFDNEAQTFLYSDFPPLSFPVIGMKPLDALCLRKDANYIKEREYLEELCKILGNVTDHKQFYLGHSPLTLAITRGNKYLVKYLLSCSNINPNDEVNPRLGVPLTVLMKYLGTSKNQNRLSILNDLEINGVNPLRLLNMLDIQDGNTHNYVQEQFTIMKQKMIDPKKANKKKSKVAMENKIKKYMNGSGNNKETNYVEMISLLEKITRDKLNMYIKGLLVRRLILEIRAGPLDPNSITVKQSKIWMSPEEFVNILKLNVEKDRVFIKHNEVLIALELLMDTEDTHFGFHVPHNGLDSTMDDINVEAGEIILKNNKSKDEFMKQLSKCVRKSDKIFAILEDKWKCKKFKITLPHCDYDKHPEVDIKPQIYEVCYICGIRSPTLLPCPVCKLVNFCSVHCNYRDFQDPTSLHKCQIVSYGSGSMLLTESQLNLQAKEGLLKCRLIAGKKTQKGMKKASQKRSSKKRSRSTVSQDKINSTEMDVQDMESAILRKDIIIDNKRKVDYQSHLAANENTQADRQKKGIMFQFRNLILQFCDNFDLDSYLPFIVLQNGNLYYKFYGERVRNIENYSFN